MLTGDLEFPDISEVYGRYAGLTNMSADVGGWLLLYARLHRDGVAVAMASNVAGSASLGLEPDAARAKAALRAGVCDFVVNDLSEALRILKNEIRQRRPVSVVLMGAVDSAVAEMVALQSGADLIPVVWSVERDPMRWLPVLDELVVGALEKIDARVRWVEASPRYLGRMFAGQRFLRMTEEEADRFLAGVREKVESGEIPVGATVARGSEMVAIGS